MESRSSALVVLLVFSLALIAGCSSNNVDTPTSPEPTSPLSVSVSSITFDYLEDSHVFTIRNRGNSSFSWTATPSENWVQLDVASGDLVAGASVEVTVDIVRYSLATGSHTATVTIETEASASAAVRLSVNHDNDSRPLSVSISSITFDYLEDSHVFTIRNRGNSSFSWTATPSENWVQL
ncbi:MAG: BACON domain-containing protein, partial [Candidatus Krumholzibacteria bacterium]|nr:BACON domain-containing protein [Candidatus Krumholzibacteria bacterium]